MTPRVEANLGNEFVDVIIGSQVDDMLIDGKEVALWKVAG